MELACGIGPPELCALPGTVKLNGACVDYADCERGLGCVSGNTSPNQFACQPYCDLASTTSASSCAKCPHDYLSYKDAQGKLSGICLAN